jgi:type I restriction enzyme S subunit
MRLEKFVKQIRGISFSPNDISEGPQVDYLPVLKANNIQDGILQTDNLIYIHRNKIKPEQLIKKGDILIAASSGSIDVVGKSVYFENDFEGSFGAFCKVIRPTKEINSEFVSIFFKTSEYKRHIKKVIQGANINNLRREDINSLEIPIFPLTEQVKITTVLRNAEMLIAQRKQSIALLDEFLRSTFLKMFGSYETMRNSKIERLGNHISYLTSGSRGWAKYFSNSGAKFLRIQNIGGGVIRTDLCRVFL